MSRETSRLKTKTAALQSSWKTISAALTFVDDDEDDGHFHETRPRRSKTRLETVNISAHICLFANFSCVAKTVSY